MATKKKTTPKPAAKPATKARPQYKAISPWDFAHIFVKMHTKGASQDEIADALGLPKMVMRQRAATLRKNGINLPKFSTRFKTDYGDLASKVDALIAELADAE